jgi:CRP/FNR family transcriptional regulator, cyclic AMP receptor protein
VRLTIEKVLVLKSVSIFAQIPEDSLVDVAAAAEEVEFPAGSVIVRQGEVGTSMYIIVDGRVRVYDGGKVLVEMKAGEVFGELSALDPKPRSATVTALEETEVFKMSQDAIYQLMSEHTDLARGIIRVLCQRIRDCDDLLRSLLPAESQVTAGQIQPPPATLHLTTYPPAANTPRPRAAGTAG